MNETRFARHFFKYLFVSLTIIIAASVAVEAQNVRLRANLDPDRNASGIIKYADVTADGNLAVMGSYSTRGAYIFDVSNGDAPVLKALYNPAPQQQFLEAIVVGNRAYFGSGTGGDGVHIVDVSNPANPVLLGKVNASNGGYATIHEMAVDGDYLYINSNSTSNRDLKVINISNPAQPRFVRNITPNNNGWVHAMYIRNGKMYTSGFYGSGLTEIYDITNIETVAPRLLGQVVSGTTSHSSWVSDDGNYLYVCREFMDGELRVYDIRNLANPVLVKVIKAADLNINGICPHNPVVKGNKLYVAWYQAGTQVFDISNPANPTRIGQFDTYQAQFVESEARAGLDALRLEPDDMICGSEALANAVPGSYNGNWTAYPLLGDDKVILSDLATGLYIVDASQATALPRNKIADYDGDGKTDFARTVQNAASNQTVWNVERSSNNSSFSTQFGLASDSLAPGDYDGDGKTDLAVTRTAANGNLIWYVLNSSSSTVRAEQFGTGTDDITVPGDYDADGKTDLAVFRRSSGTWYISQSTLGFRSQQWGQNGDYPMRGDFDSDGKTDFAVSRNTNQGKFWYIYPSSSSIPQSIQFGLSSDTAVTGDFDGDEQTDIAVYRSVTNGGSQLGYWYVQNSRTNSQTSILFGAGSDDTPIPADYDGDGKTDYAVFRNSSKTWYVMNSANSTLSSRVSAANEIPVPAAYRSVQ